MPKGGIVFYLTFFELSRREISEQEQVKQEDAGRICNGILEIMGCWILELSGWGESLVDSKQLKRNNIK